MKIKNFGVNYKEKFDSIDNFIKRRNIILRYFVPELYSLSNFKNDKIENNRDKYIKSMFTFGYKG